MAAETPSGKTPTGRDRCIADLVAEIATRRLSGDPISNAEVMNSHPELLPELEEQLRALGRVEAGRRHAEVDPMETTRFDHDENADGSSSTGPATSISIPGYRVLGEVHRGGQGIVYLAIQTSTKRKVAIKVMKEGPFAEAIDRARFDREVQILGSLNHPNIVTIHDSGATADCLFFVMNYISGRPLDEHAQHTKPSIKEALQLFAVICKAVNAAHLRGILHRDLKPSNIRVDAEGRPYILDFGLARSAGGSDASMMTMTGEFVGSMPWASPEQAEGIPGKIDVRTDVYSLGVILYYLLTDRFPYEVVGNIRDVLDNILRAEPVKPSTLRRDIDNEVETIVLKCLNKERERRYQSAGELARDVEHYLVNEPIEAKRDSTMYLLRKHLRRYRVPLAVAAGFVLLLIVSSVVAWTLYVGSQNNLRDSYLAQARAGRPTGRPGHRLDSLDALAKAAAIRPSIELRNEAIAALALPDLRVVKRIDTGFASAPNGAEAIGVTVAAPTKRSRAAVVCRGNQIEVRTQSCRCSLLRRRRSFRKYQMTRTIGGPKMIARA